MVKYFDALLVSIRRNFITQLYTRYSYGIAQYNGSSVNTLHSAMYLPYIFSLSANGDSLSQWRAYGKGEICIEFDRNKLQQSIGADLQHSTVYLEPIRPIHYMTNHELDNMLVDCIRCTLEDVYKHSGYVDHDMIVNAAEGIMPHIKKDFSPILTKHAGFEEESEWRSVINIVGQPMTDARLFIDNRGRYPTPRAKISFTAQIEHISQVITGIKFGPGTDQERARAFIEALNRVEQTSYIPSFSETPFRS